jgi:hypothetical protein
MIFSKSVTPINFSLYNAEINDLEINNRTKTEYNIETCEPIQLELFSPPHLSHSSSTRHSLPPPTPPFPSQTLRDRVFKSQTLRSSVSSVRKRRAYEIFASKIEEVNEERRILHNE